jgi:hypothetical protein
MGLILIKPLTAYSGHSSTPLTAQRPAAAGTDVCSSGKRRNTLAERMFSALPPTTDKQWLHRNDRFVPKAEEMQMKISGINTPLLSR